ncbi:MAG: hypothetical protein JSU00_05495 [Acidobacteria bacterium]|nr:hypothetical protein [Acidobacteriota bacterium]
MSTSLPPATILDALPRKVDEAEEGRWLADAVGWLRFDGDGALAAGARTHRLRELASAIDAAGLRDEVAALWRRASPERLLCDAALPDETSLLREISVGIRRRLLPQLDDVSDLYSALDTAGLTLEDADWLAGLEEPEAAAWSKLLAPSEEALTKALRLLAARIAAVGLSRDLAPIIPTLWRNEREEPQTAFDDLLEAATRRPRNPAALAEALLRCRMTVGVAHARLDEQGVTSNLVFRLDLLEAQIDRMDALSKLAAGQGGGQALAAALVRGFAEDHGLRAMVRNAVNRLARRVVEHTGRAGEHYIAASGSEWRSMGFGAMGAGAITAFTALFKYMLAAAPLAPFWTGVAHSLNYVLCFLLMQALGWALASKMPAMTASALARAMGKDDMREEVGLIAAIIRTQLVVTLGNLAGAIPCALAVDAVLRWRTGHAFLSAEAAAHGLHSMNPIGSGTLLFAAITGGFLWLASLAAGWTANWMVRRRLPVAVARSRSLGRLIGAERAQRLGKAVENDLSGGMGYVVLGFLLGLLPFIGAFGGIPLEVRHITLASASVAYDVSAFFGAPRIPLIEIAEAFAGVAATGALNLGVSFALGLWLAVRVRNLDTRGRRKLLGALWRELRTHPSRFLWRDDGEAAPRHEH